MARAFTTSDHARFAAKSHASYAALTISFWIRRTGTLLKSAAQRIIDRLPAGDFIAGYAVYSSGSGSDNNIAFAARDTGYPVIYTTGVLALNTWTHVLCDYAAADTPKGRILFDGVDQTVTGSLLSFSSVPATGVCLNGESGSPTTSPNENYQLAEVGIYSAKLTAGEIAGLVAGISPRLVRPQSLEQYMPLFRDLICERTGVANSSAGGSAQAHPRTYR